MAPLSLLAGLNLQPREHTLPRAREIGVQALGWATLPFWAAFLYALDRRAR